MTREEYLKRPLVEDVVYEISENKIRISSPHTIFIEIIKPDIISLTEMEQMFRKLKKAVKEKKNVTMKGVTKFLPTVRELYKEYLQAIETIRKNFTEAYQLSQQIKVDGIHIGCLDDEVMLKLLEKQNEIVKQHYRGTVFSEFTDYYHKIKHVYQDIQEIEHEKCETSKYIVYLC